MVGFPERTILDDEEVARQIKDLPSAVQEAVQELTRTYGINGKLYKCKSFFFPVRVVGLDILKEDYTIKLLIIPALPRDLIELYKIKHHSVKPEELEVIDE